MLGLGHVTSIASSKDKTVAANGSVTPAMAQVDTVFAAVAFDAAGRITHVSIETAQTKVNYDADMNVTSDLSAPGKTKKELGDDYGMRRASAIKKEWFEQIAEFEKWMIGKTVDEVKNLPVKRRDASHTHVPDVPELTSTVTITVQDYIAAVVEAWETARPVAPGGVKLGLGHDISIAKSTSSAAQVDLTMAAALFDKDGKVVEVIIDTLDRLPSTPTARSHGQAGEFLTRGAQDGYECASFVHQARWFEQMLDFSGCQQDRRRDHVPAHQERRFARGGSGRPRAHLDRNHHR